MNSQDSVRLLNEYRTCRQCGNNKLSNKEGSVEITEDMFIRSCKCGWKVEVNLKWVNGNENN